MIDYIERNELIKNLKYFAPEHYSGLIDNLITKQPAADVAPVRHGRWVNENFYTHCSVCGNMAIYDKYSREVESNYCPNCGCRMDGGDDE